jgi:hypothetical protein
MPYKFLHYHLTRSCTIYSQLQPIPKQHFKSWEEPNYVWSRVHMDFLGPIWNSKWGEGEGEYSYHITW